MTYHFVGIDLGGTKITAGLTDTDCVLERKVVEPVPEPADVQAVLDAMARLARQVAAPLPQPAILAVGIAVSGIVDRAGGIVRWSPNLGWRDVPLRDEIARRLQWEVFVGNDMTLATLGEWQRGAGQGACYLLGVFVGTGVGAGLVLDGRPYEGAHGAAGDIGRMGTGALRAGRGRVPDIIEAYASGPVLSAKAVSAHSAGEATVMRPDAHGCITPEEIGRAEQEGDPAALRIIGEAAEALGHAIADSALLVDPELIILGGGVIRAIPTLVHRIREIVRHRCGPEQPPPKVVAAGLGREAPVIGATVLVRMAGELGAAVRQPQGR